MTIEEIQKEIQEKAKAHNDMRYEFEKSLTPEQIEIRARMERYKQNELDSLYGKRHKILEAERMEKEKKADPYIKVIGVDVPIGNVEEKPKQAAGEVLKSNPALSNSQGGNQNGGSGSKPASSQSDLKLDAPLAKNSREHYTFPLVLKALKAKCHAWLVGPAGCGKTTLAASAARELKLSFAALSVCSQTTKTDLLGYIDAQGVYRTTSFREIYEKGGVFCLDEIDNGNANVLAVLNSALSSESNTFPDKVVKKHPNFLVVACANTFGSGAIGGYVGRIQIDAATLDRFFFIEVPHDDGLESHIAGFQNQSSPKLVTDPVPTNENWIATVRQVRAAVEKLGLKTIISPRATYMGISLIKEKVPSVYLEKGLLYKSMSADLIAKINQS